MKEGLRLIEGAGSNAGAVEREALLIAMSERIIAGERLADLDDALFQRLCECREKFLCRAVCGKCRAHRARRRKFHRAITEAEWQAAMAELWRRRGFPFSAELVNRFVHARRRRNAPYRAADLRICARVTENEQDEVRAKARARGLSVNEHIRAALELEDRT